MIIKNKPFCNCEIWIYPKEQKIKKCPTCLSLAYHKSIYEGLSSAEAMILFKKRTLKAFERGLK